MLTPEECPMLSIRDCLDYCDLTEDEVSLFAEHTGIPEGAAAQMICGMVQTPEGVLVLTHYMLDLVERANAAGDPEQLERARALCKRFMADHPLPH
jgi:hypothetical protein